jgi:hypothetical protein
MLLTDRRLQMDPKKMRGEKYGDLRHHLMLTPHTFIKKEAVCEKCGSTKILHYGV